MAVRATVSKELKLSSIGRGGCGKADREPPTPLTSVEEVFTEGSVPYRLVKLGHRIKMLGTDILLSGVTIPVHM